MTKVYPVHDSSMTADNYQSHSRAEIYHDDQPECRICSDSEVISPLITPCQCSGSLKYIHVECMFKWIRSQHKMNKGKYSLYQMSRCEICQDHYPVKIRTQTKINCQRQDVSEKICDNIFHFIAALLFIGVSVTLFILMMIMAIVNLSWPFGIPIVLAVLIGSYLVYYLMSKFFIDSFEMLGYEQKKPNL